MAKSSDRLTTRHWQPARGWDAPLPAELDSPHTLVLAFGASRCLDEPGALHALREAFPQSALLGCSSAGEILGCRVHDDGVVAGILRFERTELRTVRAEIGPGAASFAAGQSIARQLQSPDLRGIVVLSDGTAVNGSELVHGIASVTPPSIPVTGGLAADGDRFQRTWVLDREGPHTHAVVALGLYGDSVVITHGSKGGWDIFGIERVVTRAAGNVVYAFDDKPALQLYKEYLGERAAGLPATALLFPLAMRTRRDDDRRLVRTVLAVSEADQSLTFAGDVPEGALVQLMRANFDRLVEGASDAAEIASVGADTTRPLLSMAVSCVGRRLVLGERTEEELEATLDVLPAQAAQVGFYSYGEISPFVSGTCDLHNQTMTLTTLSERG